MPDLIPFDFDGNAVRVVRDERGNPWFVAKDVCEVLELTNPTEAVRPLDDDEKSTLRITEGGPERVILSESGLYSLIFTSRKPEARRFRKWVTAEVLPALRRTGRFETAPFREQAARVPAASALKVSHRVQLLVCAVQAVKMKSGNPEDIPAMYEAFCILTTDAPRISSSPEADTLVNRWADRHLAACGDRSRKIQAQVLYDHFRRWCLGEGVDAPPSMVRWGKAMKERFAFVEAGYVWYFVTLEQERPSDAQGLCGGPPLA